MIPSVGASHGVLQCYQGAPTAARAPGGLVDEAEEVAPGGEGVCVEADAVEKAAIVSPARQVHVPFPWKLDPTSNLCFLPTDSWFWFG